MKKQYTAPSMKAFTVKATEILAGSNGSTSITSAGTNNINGGPTVAEGKRGSGWDWDEE